MRNPPWSYEETLLAFELYCRTPFGRIHKTNSEVIKLSEILSKNGYRSPSAVAMKMCNLAYCNTERNKGLKNNSYTDRKVWEDYLVQGYDLIAKAIEIRNRLENKSGLEELQQSDLQLIYDKDAWIESRMRMRFFREAVIAAYNAQCCITGINVPSFLKASYIRPWKDCTNKDRANPQNGLCLNALHGKAFDQGYITINKNCEIVVSEKLKKMRRLDDTTRALIIKKEGEKIFLPKIFKPAKEFIEYHNDIVFVR